MTRAQVGAILGKPLTLRGVGANVSTYGYITYPSLPHKYTMCFALAFDSEDRVQWKHDPFGGVVPTGVRPTKPRLVAPQHGSAHTHFPRLLDVRWTPSAGEYPIVYDLEVGLGWPADPESFRDHVEWQEYGQPYALIAFPGSQPGRLRVRGRNVHGTGPWSEFHVFRFDVPADGPR
jgi:hypothetical protein